MPRPYWLAIRSARFSGRRSREDLAPAVSSLSALRMICDREEEINAFIPEEYWTLEAIAKSSGFRKKPAAAHYSQRQRMERRRSRARAELDALT
ncbi:MAG: hypothetical protein ACLSH1_07440 [Clostridia bacterium]